MKITDLNGLQIEVTDLEAALGQAGCFKDFHHVSPNPMADKRQQVYWTDIYNKLITLKSKHHEQSGK